MRKSPSIVEELLHFNNSKQLQCLHSDASSSEATLSEGSWSPWELQKQMLGIMLEDMACDRDIFDCVKEKLERSQKSSSPYLTELMTAVCQAAVKENTSCPVHAALLQKGLPVVLEDRHSKKDQQMKALKDLQELIVTLDRPPNLLRMFFTCMCEEDVSSEDSCCKYGTGKDQDEQLGKGVALKTVTAFFTWLREAEPLGN
ncbi:eukaryotic translation initiation factor 4 gamma 3-like [Platichthys flesus]|uniref:eukaryotic translation initiation factor 4 gamma 3-like n=1 Tax=Platichthys flesus TaxID=8260 RepID=UPI002DB733F0|nr:eukaryotic translation initiation factor 4 gamma 3-like [Platichthys flesus]